MPKPENICPRCDAWKNEQYDLCYDCNQQDLKDSGNICDCGNYKKAEYDTCYDCYQENS